MTSQDLVTVGDAAPDVTLPDDLNRPTRFSELWQRCVRHSG